MCWKRTDPATRDLLRCVWIADFWLSMQPHWQRPYGGGSGSRGEPRRRVGCGLPELLKLAISVEEDGWGKAASVDGG